MVDNKTIIVYHVNLFRSNFMSVLSSILLFITISWLVVTFYWLIKIDIDNKKKKKKKYKKINYYFA